MHRIVILFALLAVALPPLAPVDPGAALIPNTYGLSITLPGEDLPDRLMQLRALLGMETDLEALMQALTDAVFPEIEVSFAGDIYPWLGEYIAVGYNDDDDFVVVAATKNPDLSDMLVARVIDGAEAKGTLIEETTLGDITTYIGGGVALARFSGHVAFGTPEGIAQAAAVQQGEANALADWPAAQQVFAHFPVDRFASVYINREGLNRVLPAPGLALLAPVLGENAITGAGIAASEQGRLVRLDAVAGFEQPVPAPVMSTGQIGEAVVDAVPENALGFVAAYDLRVPTQAGLYAFALEGYMQRVRDAIEANVPVAEQHIPTQEETETIARGLTAAASLALSRSGVTVDLRRDVLDWLSGEYAVGVLPNPEGLYGDARLPIDVFMVMQVIDRNAAMNIVEIASRALSEQLGLVPTLIDAAGYSLRAVPDPATGEYLFIFGLAEKHLIVATGTSIKQVLAVVNGDAPGLAERTAWETRYQALAPEGEALGYIATSGLPHAIAGLDIIEDDGVIAITLLAEAR